MNKYDEMCADDPADFALPLDMVLQWGASYSPKSFSLVPTFVADRKVWPL